MAAAATGVAASCSITSCEGDGTIPNSVFLTVGGVALAGLGVTMNHCYLSNQCGSKQPCAVEKEDEEYIAAESFDGSKPGYKFQMGPKGLGYYKDVIPVPTVGFKRR